MLFTLSSNLNGERITLTAEWSGRRITVMTPRGPSLARNLRQATRIAADVLGPVLERAGRTGAEWGLYVRVEGGAGALFGQFPPDAASPTLRGPEAKPSEPIAQIFRQWERDGTPLGALGAAIRIIEIYARRGLTRAAA